MRKCVFISHSSSDSVAAQSICEYLEENGISCWIDSRDIRPGQEYGEQIIDAIAACDAVVLLLSSSSNESSHVSHEAERAVDKQKMIIPVRIEQVPPSKSLEFFIRAKQFLDAFVPPLKERLLILRDVIAGTPLQKPSLTVDVEASRPQKTVTKGIVTGNRVNLRSGPTVVAKRIGCLFQGDELRIVDQVTVTGSGECQLRDDFMFQPEAGQPYRLMSGRAFVISGETETHYRIEVQRRFKADIGYIPKEKLTLLDPALWYKVITDQGEGWLYGRYVRAF